MTERHWMMHLEMMTSMLHLSSQKQELLLVPDKYSSGSSTCRIDSQITLNVFMR